jgi:hypothetical protein
MATENTTLPPGVEIFRAGRRTADNGTTYDFSDADIDAIAASYSPALREAPLVVGHPAANLPAYGWVARAAARPSADGRVLTMDTRAVEPQFAEMVRLQRFPKRSASFYHPTHPNNPTPGKWYLRHVGFLGAQPPAVPGLKDIQFNEQADAGVVCFSESPAGNHQEQSTMNEEEKKRLEEAEAAAAAAKKAQADAEAESKRAKEQLAQFSEQQREQRHAGHVEFCEAAVKGAKLKPTKKAAAIAVLDLLGESQAVEFAEGDTTTKLSPVDFVKGLIADAAPAVSFGEFAPGGAGKSVKDMSDAEIDKAARDFAAKHNVSYSEALDKVASFTA